MPKGPKPSPAPLPQSVATLAGPPPPTYPPAQQEMVNGNQLTSPTTMTIDGISGGAALIGISQGPLASDPDGKVSGPNVHVVIKASSRLRLQEFLKEALAHNTKSMKSSPDTMKQSVFLHLSTHYLMLEAKGKKLPRKPRS